MYLVPVTIKESKINGKGVFAKQAIPKDTIVWKFAEGHDLVMSKEQYASLESEKREDLDRVAYLSATTDRYVYPPEGDPARFTNHSDENNLSVVVNPQVSVEPYFVANRDIEPDEELTNNYLEFDQAAKEKSDWQTLSAKG